MMTELGVEGGVPEGDQSKVDGSIVSAGICRFNETDFVSF